jgi:hypothetical protein
MHATHLNAHHHDHPSIRRPSSKKWNKIKLPATPYSSVIRALNREGYVLSPTWLKYRKRRILILSRHHYPIGSISNVFWTTGMEINCPWMNKTRDSIYCHQKCWKRLENTWKSLTKVEHTVRRVPYTLDTLQLDSLVMNVRNSRWILWPPVNLGRNVQRQK